LTLNRRSDHKGVLNMIVLVLIAFEAISVFNEQRKEKGALNCRGSLRIC